MVRDKRVLIAVFISIICISIALYWVLTPSTTPWTDTGRLVLLVHATPGATEESVLGIGIDDIELYGKNGDVTRVTVLNRRVQLVPGEDELRIILDTSVPIGSYSGFRFTIKSPELRNAWEQDLAPEYVTLLNDTIALDIPYQIEKDITSAIVLSFETTRAMYEKEEQRYYLPIIQIETRRNAVVETTEETASVSGGTIEHNATFGMDWSGHIRFNYREKHYVPVPEDNTYTPHIPAEEEVHEESVAEQATTTGTTTEPQATSTATTTEEVSSQQATTTT